MKLIPLTQGQFAKVDDSDYEWLMQWKWQAAWDRKSRSFYAIRTASVAGGKPKKTIRMARAIIGPECGPRVDHVDHDTLNNQRYNLRSCTATQNRANDSLRCNNTSGFKGVGKSQDGKHWRADISVNRRHIYLGQFESKEEAALVYDNKAREVRGEFAALNLPRDGECECRR
jgi:hypothetical protein